MSSVPSQISATSGQGSDPARRALRPSSPSSNIKPSPAVTLVAAKDETPSKSETKRKRDFMGRSWQSIRRIYRTLPSEKEKVPVKKSWRRALLRCSVHFVPIMATGVLAYLNIKGYFIGGQLTGDISDSAQALYRLGLQVAAKLMELFTVASLGNIILTIVRRELVFDNGIPLGLIHSPSRFTQATYFFSTAFWSCVKFPAGLRKRLFLIGSIFGAALIAVFAGPATALLLIPEVRPTWPGGGTILWLRGKRDDLWPSHLGVNNIGGPDCATPGQGLLRISPANTTKCLWHASGAFSEMWKTSRLNPDPILFINDGLARRSLQVTKFTDGSPNIETWTLSTNAALARHSLAIARRWWISAFYADGRQEIFGKIKAATRRAGISRVNSPIPAVRTACSEYRTFDLQDIVRRQSRLSYHYFPEYDFLDEEGDAIYIPVAKFINSTRISTQWCLPPTGKTDLKGGAQTDRYASAYLFIHVPLANSNGTAAAFTCTVDARWGPGSTVAMNIPDKTQYVQPELTNIRRRNESYAGSEQGFLPINDGTWTTVSISSEWLAALTPLADPDAEGFTTFASALEAAGVDNSTGFMPRGNWRAIRAGIESLLATTVADGMSRIGLDNNEIAIEYVPKDIDAQILGDGEAIVPPDGGDKALANLTQVHWQITVSGYAYKADETAHYLALFVLFAHLAFAIAHIIYVLFTRTAPVAWGTSEELIVLSQNSPPASTTLENTCAGIQSRKTFRRVIRIRALKEEARSPGVETLHMVFEDDYDGSKYEAVKLNKAYGSG